jgi:SAM-dependent methyltransferase
MAHAQQLAFARAIASGLAKDWSGRRVLEIGSYDVNGSIRGFFGGSDYTGVDLVEGPGVDLVGSGHTVAFPEAAFDLSISCECFEHDRHWPETLLNMYRATRPGGVAVFTCATTGRPEHGTRRTKASSSPGTQSIGSDYYRNLRERDFRRAVRLDALFSSYFFHHNPPSQDLYFCGIKAGGEPVFGCRAEALRPAAVALVEEANQQVAAGRPRAAERRPSWRRLLSPVAQGALKLALLLPDPWYQDVRLGYDRLKKNALGRR